MNTGCKVHDAMTKRPVTVKQDTTIEKCAKLMAKEMVGSILVVEKEKCLGILTEYDIVRKVVAEGKKNDTKVSEVMTKNPFSVNPNQDISEAAVIMGNNNIRHMPVMDGEKFMGFLTAKDVLKVQPELLNLIVDKYHLREEENKPVRSFYEHDGVCELCGEYASKIFQVDGSNVCVKCRNDL